MAQLDQRPVKSNFHSRSTGTEVLANWNLMGKTAIITGGYSGIGLETTRALASKGVKVIVPARSRPKAIENLKEVDGDVEVTFMDLADLNSVLEFADKILNEYNSIDFLINNAGIMACPESRIGPGWEAQFGINHMGHFALTSALMPLIKKTDGVRVISLTSTAHKLSDIRWDDIQYTSGKYDKWQAYGQSKTANALFANALSRRLKGSGGLAFSVHPGGILTPLQRHLPKEEMVAFGWIDDDGNPTELAKKRFKSPEQGCSTTLWAATSKLLQNQPGVYCEDCNIAETLDPSSPMARFMGVEPHACDDASAERLWKISEDLLAEARA
ncbi:MAG: SDR family NAD(P)-dependent oxidoreductase [Saprospiraceae bacterium]|nr:SDR family NAD(P)-dependent oxidoreductase [Saprospiraceae bacterium]